MSASLEVQILVSIAAVATLYVWVLSWIMDARFRRLTRWLKATYPDRWNELPWSLREFNRVGAVIVLRKGEIGETPEFKRRHADTKLYRKRQAALAAVAMVAMAVTFLGVQHWGWHFDRP